MAFGATLSITVNTVAKVLNRINQDNYGSEYYLRGTLDAYRVKIRHSKDSPNASGQVYDRHNVEVTRTIFATSTVPEYVQTNSYTNKTLASDSVVDAGYLFAGYVDYLDSATVQGDLLTWQN
jgi:hypothetical protein